MNLEPFSTILQRTSGLTIRSAAAPAMTSFIEERMRTLGLNQPEEYQQRLEQDADECQRLIEAAAVPETWFHRDQVAFETLAKLAKDRLQKDPTPLRILCLPCSTGEEAYTIAAVLTEAGLTPEQFTLDAVDISRSAIAAAQAGEYKAPAFRKAPEDFRTKHFTALSEDSWKLNAPWKDSVRFQAGNLLQLESFFNGEAYDFVFNRNLLIFFARPDQAKGLASLRKLIKPDGVIFVAAGEGGIFLANGFRTLRIPHAFAFRLAPPRQEPKPKPEPKEADKSQEKEPTSEAASEPGTETEAKPDQEAAPARKPAAKTAEAKETDDDSEADAADTSEDTEEKGEDAEGEPAEESREEGKRGRREPKQKQKQGRQQPKKQEPKEPSAPRKATSPEDTVSIMEDIKDLAEAGDMAQAEGKLRGLLAGGSSDPDAHYLMGLLQDAQGDAQKAMATYRRVIQLDGNHAEAMKQLVVLLEEAGDKPEAERISSRLNRISKHGPRRQGKPAQRGSE